MFRDYYPVQPTSQMVLPVVQHCEAVCEYTLTVIMGRPDVQMRVQQMQLLRDCADICTLTAKFIARCSVFAREIAALCAQICEACGNHCLRHPDPESQYCGRVCLHCAQLCRAFASSAGGMSHPGSYSGMESPIPGYPGMGMGTGMDLVMGGYTFYGQSENKEEKKEEKK